MNGFLPINRKDMEERGWSQVDFAYVIADAYVDHSSFGPAIISRVLESRGYKVGIISQPDWKNPDSIDVFGKPRLGFLISGGNMDSMVNHFTVNKKKRKNDAYTPGGVMGKRPDHATVVYGNLIRQKYKDVPVIIGGIEASLRRLAHYDYWSDSLKRSILLDSQADIISYGMGENSIVEIADALDSGLLAEHITYIPGTVYKTKDIESVYDYLMLPSYEELCNDKVNYAKSFLVQYQNTDPFSGKRLVEPYDKGIYVVQNPASKPLTTMELDDVYSLPYMNTYHPSYEALGGIPALEEVKFSIVGSRGCFGNCSFCAITFHQGRAVQSRSKESIVKEAKEMTEMKDFKGYIHDVGGPTANFRKPACNHQLTIGACKVKQCLSPGVCKNMEVDHREFIDVLRSVRSLPKVKKVFVRSGIRYDYVMADKDDTFFKELVEHHVSGQLKVAPEHVSEEVLKHMGKPAGKTYEQFRQKFFRITEKLGKKQYIIPYLMSSHPGSTLKEAIELAEYLRDIKYQPEQVQDFYPTPGTLSTTIFYTGLDPITMKPVYVPKTKEEKAMQRALLQFSNPKNYNIVYDALVKAGREDLIGNGPKCLIKSKEQRYREAHGLVRPKSKSKSKNNKPSVRNSNKNSKNSSSRSNSSSKQSRDARNTKGGKRGNGKNNRGR